MKFTVGADMTKELITVKKATPLEEAYQTMARHRIRHLPVVDEKNEIVGVLSDRDVQRGMNSEVKDSMGARVENLTFRDGSLTSDYMSWPVYTIDADFELRRAVERMMRDKLSCLLVRHNGTYVGIITTDDMLRVLAKLLDEKEGAGMKIKDFFTDGFMQGLAY
jgi:CBS domain-containing protein